jgi:hypothetical protein
MSGFPAGETAETGQARAAADLQLGVLVSHARRIAATQGRTRAMATVALSLELAQDPPELLRGLLLAAVWRLAWDPADPENDTNRKTTGERP